MDPVYGSDLVTKFVNSLMYQGKKSTAEGIFYKALTQLEQKGGAEALTLFKKAVENAKPLLEVKSRRVGGANYQVPVEVNADRRTSLAIRWLITYSRGRAEKGMGNARVTVRNLRVLGVEKDDNLLVVEGSVPGPNGGYLIITKAKKAPRERRGFAGAATVDPLKAAKRAAKKG